MDRLNGSAGWPGLPSQVAIERAIAEFRCGRPVAILDGDSASLVVSVEAIDVDAAAALERLGAGTARLVLPPARLRRIGLDRAQAGPIALPRIDLARLENLALRIDGRADAPVCQASPLDLLALEL